MAEIDDAAERGLYRGEPLTVSYKEGLKKKHGREAPSIGFSTVTVTSPS